MNSLLHEKISSTIVLLIYHVLTNAFSSPIHVSLNDSTTTTGHNQVGYYAKETGNEEFLSPSIIDKHAESGIIVDRPGYTKQWCAPLVQPCKPVSSMPST
jgi:hypothetical protein